MIVSGRSAERGNAVVDEIRASGGTAAFVAVDLSAGEPEIRRFAELSAEAAGGRLDILVNNAALLLMPTPTAEVSAELLRDAFGVNVFAPFLLTGAIAPAMAEAGGGAIVNIGSITGLRGAAGSALYTAPTRPPCTPSRPPGPTSSARTACGSTPSPRGRSPPSVSRSTPTTSPRYCTGCPRAG
ncbi:hypothetical protein MINS_13660 [Mycolicibacterium insubricum]|nr:hypothetical protein MINS_13660 [Mycolicibacterium insubricum]